MTFKPLTLYQMLKFPTFRYTISLSSFLLILNVIDILLTAYALPLGYTELNPFGFTPTMIFIKVSGVIFILSLCIFSFKTKRYKLKDYIENQRFATILVLLATLFYTVIITSNILFLVKP